jgi:NifU-like protein involved in Fe-S cluster formation
VNVAVSYNDAVRQHFASPQHAGDLQGRFERTLVAEVSDSGKGARIVVAAGIGGGVIVEMAFRVWGCPHLIAALDSACALLVGQPVGSLENCELADITRELSVPAEKMGRILLLKDALVALWAQHGSAED